VCPLCVNYSQWSTCKTSAAAQNHKAEQSRRLPDSWGWNVHHLHLIAINACSWKCLAMLIQFQTNSILQFHLLVLHFALISQQINPQTQFWRHISKNSQNTNTHYLTAKGSLTGLRWDLYAWRPWSQTEC